MAGCIQVCGAGWVLQSFELGASASPDSIAVVCEGRQVTYCELNLTAERIAYGLREAGAAGGTLVGVFLDRSAEMVAGLLGIWKAGGAYIPLDPAAPPHRTAVILEDSAPPFVLTSNKLAGALPDTVARLIHLDDLCGAASAADEVLPRDAAILASADSIAYVIYTSGSTGKPKGVSISHGALANTIRAVGRDLMLRMEDVVLAWATIAFDVACLEIFLPLTFGASLYLVAQDVVNGGGSRLEALRRSDATIMFATPTMYRLLIEEGWQGDVRMQLIVGGEVLPLTLARRLARMCRVLWNQYGPTETAICATRARIEADVDKVTIGCPLPNVSVYLLDSFLQPVPQGGVGELYIGGAGVGLGYLNRPDLNRVFFLPDPFADGAPRLIYKSGDLAVQLEDGRLDFIGRVDGQVKIRGFRIELGEIESALRQCEGVQAVVVRAIELEAGDRRLVAFVVGDAAFLSARWRESLSRQLPAYMIPTEFVSLPYLPTTASGKVDGQALDRLRPSVATLPATAGASPADDVEARLKSIWQRLLKVNTFGMQDDFFALGGHSLLAARMLVQIEKQFGCKLPPSAMVEHPTIHGLGTYLRQTPLGKWPPVATIQAGADLPPLFIAHGVGGSVLSFVELAVQLGPQQPVYGLQLPTSIDEHQANLRILAGNYLQQVRAIQPSGPYNFAGHSSGGLVVFEMACQLSEQGERVGLLALLDCDPNTGKVSHNPFRDWDAFKASLKRARAEWKLRALGADLLRRRIDYQRIKIRAWLADRARRSGKGDGGFAGAEGYLALALRDYNLGTYAGDITLFVGQDEAGSDAEPAQAWAGRILGRCETQLIPGTHATILKRPQVISLAREIRDRLPKTLEADARSVTA